MEINEVAVTFVAFNDRAHCQELVLVEVNCGVLGEELQSSC